MATVRGKRSRSVGFDILWFVLGTSGTMRFTASIMVGRFLASAWSGRSRRLIGKSQPLHGFFCKIVPKITTMRASLAGVGGRHRGFRVVRFGGYSRTPGGDSAVSICPLALPSSIAQAGSLTGHIVADKPADQQVQLAVGHLVFVGRHVIS